MRRSLSVFIAALIALTMLTYAQDKKTKDQVLKQKQENLLRISAQLKIESETNRHEAEIKAMDLKIPIRATLQDGSIIELQKFENGIPVYYSTDNARSSTTESTDKCYPGTQYNQNLTGSTETLGEWDGGGVRTTHQEFGGRVVQRDTPSGLMAHSTHVAGTMIAAGVTATAKGMSYQAHLDAYDWNSDLSEMAAAAARGLRVSNHSYGQLTGWVFNYFGDGKYVWFGDERYSTTEDYHYGFYDSDARNWDNVAYNAPYYLICKAAGNDRNAGPSTQPVSHWYWNNGLRQLSTTVREKSGGTDGYDCIAHSALAKNIMTVAAVSPIAGGYTKPSDVVMSSFSSWGPTDDGRIKPDISADGVGLYSCFSSADNAYGTMSGTSMATPSVTGSVGIILQKQRQLHGSTPLLASTIKGLIIHTADEAGTNPGPDYAFGWGLMNTLKAVQLMDDNAKYSSDFLIRELSITTGQTIQIDAYSDGTSPIKATICWTDPAGTPVTPSLNPRNKMLVNDLDVRVVNGTTTTSPWVLNPANPSAAATRGDNTVDNVEQVLVATPTVGAVKIIITTKGIAGNGSQDFSLLLSGVTNNNNVQTLQAPTLAQPADAATSVSLTPSLSWNPSTGATNYQVQASTASDFATTVVNAANLTSTQYTVSSSLNNSTTYFWRVRCADSQDTSAWSSVRSFTTVQATPPPPQALAAPVLSSPSNSATNTSLTPALSWNAVTNATSYTVQVSGDATFATTIKNVSGLSTTSYSITSGLSYQTKYFWRVKASNADTTSPWSTVFAFTTLVQTQTPSTLTINLPDVSTCKYADVQLGSTTTVNGTTVSTTATGGSGDYTFSWYPATGLSSATSPNPTAVSPYSSKTYILTVKDNVSGQTKKDTMLLTVNKAPTTSFSYTSVNIVLGSSVSLGNYLTVSSGKAPYTYEWTTVYGYSSTDVNPSVSPTTSTYYGVVVTDANGCASTKKYLYVRVTKPRQISEEEPVPGYNNIEGLNVYPNPTSSIVNFDLSLPEKSDLNIRLTDILGHEVVSSIERSGVDSFHGSIDMNSLPSGVYSLQVRINNKLIVKKIIKE